MEWYEKLVSMITNFPELLKSEPRYGYLVVSFWSSYRLYLYYWANSNSNYSDNSWIEFVVSCI